MARGSHCDGGCLANTSARLRVTSSMFSCTELCCGQPTRLVCASFFEVLAEKPPESPNFCDSDLIQLACRSKKGLHPIVGTLAGAGAAQAPHDRPTLFLSNTPLSNAVTQNGFRVPCGLRYPGNGSPTGSKPLLHNHNIQSSRTCAADTFKCTGLTAAFHTPAPSTPHCCKHHFIWKHNATHCPPFIPAQWQHPRAQACRPAGAEGAAHRSVYAPSPS